MGLAARETPEPTARHSGATPGDVFEQQRQAAQRDQDAGQHVGGGAVERRAVLVEDRRGERREAQHLQRPELGEQVERHEQGATGDRRAELRQDDPHERAHRTQPERPGGVVERRIEPAQRRGHREQHQREVRQRRDQHGTAEALDPRRERHPRVAVDEGRHGERCDQERPPDGRNGRFVRSTSHAAETPMTGLAATPATTRRTVFDNSSPTRGRTSRRYASSQPTAIDSTTTKTSGMLASRPIDTRGDAQRRWSQPHATVAVIADATGGRRPSGSVGAAAAGTTVEVRAVRRPASAERSRVR